MRVLNPLNINYYFSVRFVLLPILTISCNSFGSTPKNFVYTYEREVVSVDIQHIEGTCSSLRVQYYVNEINDHVDIPKGISGVDDNYFSRSVFVLHGEYNIPMKVDAQNPNNSEEKTRLFFNKSPYEIVLKLSDRFDLKSGRFYIDYLHVIKQQNLTSSSIMLIDVVRSERHYLEIDQNSCIVNFL